MNLFSSNKEENSKSKYLAKKKDELTLLQEENIIKQITQFREIRIFGYFKPGYGTKKTECQDCLCIMEQFMEDISFMGVFDGHGSSGKEASQAANDFIQTYLESNSTKNKLKQLAKAKDGQREDFLLKIIKLAEDKLKSSGIDYGNSGTCVLCILLYKNMAYICNVGDSRAVLYRETPREKLAIELSYDHKPTRPDEKERIIRQGGKIEKCYQDGNPMGPYRVWMDEDGPGIANTRSLGDIASKKIGIISLPEIQHFELQRTDQFIILATDGLWNVMSSAEACGFVRQHEPKDQAAEALVLEARQRWDELNKNKKVHIKINDTPNSKYGCDDITVVICFLLYGDKEEL